MPRNDQTPGEPGEPGDPDDPGRVGPRVGTALALAAGAVVTVWLAVVALWEPATTALTFDDAFYYLGIGRNLAEGLGSTFDGINDTNGYHPLWMGVVTGLFVVGLDGDDATRAMLAIQVLCWGVCLLCVARVADRMLQDWPTGRRGQAARRPATWTIAAVVGLVAVNPYVVRIVVNGMESALAVALGAVLLVVMVGRRGRWLDSEVATGRQLGLATLLSAIFLARTDAVLLLACVGLAVLLEWWRRDDRGAAFARAALLLGPPGVVAIAYLTYNQLAFGTWLQVSGLIKRAELTPGRIVAMGVVLAGAVALIAFGVRRVTDAPGATRRRRGSTRFPVAGRFVTYSAAYGAFCLLVLGYYPLLQTQQWLWYFAPVGLWLLALLALGSADMLDTAQRQAAASMRPSRSLRPIQLLLVVPSVVVLVLAGMRIADPELRAILDANEEAGTWLADLPEGSLAASWDAGMLGYAAGGVLNLDGVVNSHDFYLATRDGYGALARFLDCAGVTHIANHGGDVDGRDPDIERFIERTWGQDAAAGAVVVHRVPFTFSGTTVGSGGRQQGGDMAVFVYALPGDQATRCGAG